MQGSTLWEDWRTHYLESHAVGLQECASRIIIDGILHSDVSVYFESRPRIVFVVKECNRPPESNDLGAYFRKHRLHGQLAKNLARWAAVFYEPNSPVSDLLNDDVALEKALFRCAVVNLKKIAGGPSAIAREINLFAHHDREPLRRQIKELKPDIVIACGVIDQLVWLLDLNPETVDRRTDNGKSQTLFHSNRFNCRVIPFRHPSRVTKPLELMEQMRGWMNRLLKESVS